MVEVKVVVSTCNRRAGEIILFIKIGVMSKFSEGGGI
jgi:hypothetical protein